MAHTFSALYYHLVFSTKHRKNHLRGEFDERLWLYLGGISRNLNLTPLEIGGMEDHIHMLLKAPPMIAPSDLAKKIKGYSSKWAHDTFPAVRDFSWQDGYGVFAVSKSNVSVVANYIRNQPKHHRGRSFDDEYIDLMRAHEIEFDEAYLLG